MVETVEIKQDETTSEKPVEENVAQSKPEGLPEKFNSVEDLAKSYQELEKKLGDNTEAPKVDAPKEETKNDLEIAEKAVESAGLNMENLSSEYAEKGELDAKSYEALEKAGIPKDYVDQFIEGQKAVAEQQATSIKDIVGGAESYAEMSNWAADNMTDAEKSAYNTAVNSKNLETAKLVCIGAGSAGIASMRLLVSLGANKNNIFLVDRKGVVHAGRDDLNINFEPSGEKKAPPS